ncbi:nucleoid-associated protein [Sphingobacterium multivorum]|uniref:nucleoid-associated protein n=1 Tax=Sphingobacterium multivorum TaxID=28454 RepID=UPI00289E3EE0|nr:nucleoid-associated protein [Sphingobacterium multivorum]
MLFFQDSKIKAVSVHRVGNKIRDEFYQLSDSPLNIDEQDNDTRLLLMNFFCSPFPPNSIVHRLYHPSETLELNEVFHYASDFFAGVSNFQETSELLTKHLYDVCNHLKINSGEFYTVHFEGVQFEGEECEALAVYKADKKELYIEASPDQGNYRLNIARAMGLYNLDKAAIILNCEKDQGYKVIISGGTKDFERVYWQDEFLQVKLRNDSNFQTEATIRIFKTFVDGLDEVFEVEKMDKIDLLNKAQAYFKENDTFSQEDFEELVIGSEQAIELFRISKANAEELLDTKIPDDFPLSNAVIKKSKAGFKNTIKLDKNFQISVHGKRELIERGFDDKKGMNYYKVYFENES